MSLYGPGGFAGVRGRCGSGWADGVLGGRHHAGRAPGALRPAKAHPAGM